MNIVPNTNGVDARIESDDQIDWMYRQRIQTSKHASNTVSTWPHPIGPLTSFVYILNTNTHTFVTSDQDKPPNKITLSTLWSLITHKVYSMPPVTASESPESDVTSTDVFKDTELTLGLPGETRSSGGKTCTKRGFIETTTDLNHLGGSSSSSSQTRGKTLAGEDVRSESLVSGAGKPTAAK